MHTFTHRLHINSNYKMYNDSGWGAMSNESHPILQCLPHHLISAWTYYVMLPNDQYKWWTWFPILDLQTSNWSWLDLEASNKENYHANMPFNRRMCLWALYWVPNTMVFLINQLSHNSNTREVERQSSNAKKAFSSPHNQTRIEKRMSNCRYKLPNSPCH